MTRIISIVGGLQPSTPTIGTATAGEASASVAFTASSYIGKGTITYTATSSPGGFTGTSATSPITVSGLTNGTAYTFTVTGTTNYGVTSLTSGSSNSITPAVADAGVMFPLGSIAVGSAGTSSITFTSIPSTYKHLQIRYSAFTNRSGAGLDDFNMRINADTGSNYSTHRLYGNGSTATGDATAVSGSSMIGISYCGTTVANYPGSAVIDFLDYANTNKAKVVRSFSGIDVNGTVSGVPGYIFLTGGAWYNTSALTSITLFSNNGATITQNSQFSLYGIKGA